MTAPTTWPDRLERLAHGTIDFHTHAIDPELPDIGATYRGSFPRVERTGERSARIIVDGRGYRDIDDACWSADTRVSDMDAEGIAVQVLSPIPVTLCHEQPASGAAILARAQNDFLATLVASAPQRFLALGTVPMQDPPSAIRELTRCITELGFVGVEIGTRVGEFDLTDARFRPFFDAASSLSAVIFIHPVDRDVDPRVTNLGLGFGVGMPTETATAAAALLAAGVVQAARGARFVLAHGAGALPALLPRLDQGQRLAAHRAGAERLSDAARRLWCDSLTYDAASLQLALQRFGAGHVVLGTDYPFAAREHPAGEVLTHLDPPLQRRIGTTNACALCSDVRHHLSRRHVSEMTDPTVNRSGTIAHISNRVDVVTDVADQEGHPRL
ncbi:MAG: amidohydrolase family protein [Mycobacterium sp.]|uniref:amidohydrolase family protein n=1 Tax=Mycobacterium sp. TaxID=1785 RepID=UPI0026151496|nr:amidohydrolase family protein [Mycobacterium sp.]MDI3313805.1 amidohydrolase family protein [Mycobacterium sp.]